MGGGIRGPDAGSTELRRADGSGVSKLPCAVGVDSTRETRRGPVAPPSLLCVAAPRFVLGVAVRPLGVRGELVPGNNDEPTAEGKRVTRGLFSDKEGVEPLAETRRVARGLFGESLAELSLSNCCALAARAMLCLRLNSHACRFACNCAFA